MVDGLESWEVEAKGEGNDITACCFRAEAFYITAETYKSSTIDSTKGAMVMRKSWFCAGLEVMGQMDLPLYFDVLVA